MCHAIADSIKVAKEIIIFVLRSTILFKYWNCFTSLKTIEKLQLAV
jgi:hypothetical protein